MVGIVAGGEEFAVHAEEASVAHVLPPLCRRTKRTTTCAWRGQTPSMLVCVQRGQLRQLLKRRTSQSKHSTAVTAQAACMHKASLQYSTAREQLVKLKPGSARVDVTAVRGGRLPSANIRQHGNLLAMCLNSTLVIIPGHSTCRTQA